MPHAGRQRTFARSAHIRTRMHTCYAWSFLPLRSLAVARLVDLLLFKGCALQSLTVYPDPVELDVKLR